MDALILLAALVVLAAVAPRWGYDSRDGVASEQYRLRSTWLAEPRSLRSGRRTPATGETTSVERPSPAATPAVACPAR